MLLVIPDLVMDRASAQTISLPGTVVIQNSEYETGKKIYVSDASIRAPFAKAVTSDKAGQFTLVFADVERGSALRITVSKPGYEVVNQNEVEEVMVGRVLPLVVVMADPVHLDRVAAKFNGIAQESLKRAFQQKLHALRDSTVDLASRLGALEQVFNDTLTSLGEALVALSEHHQQALDNAQVLARDLARVDLDQASALYRDALTRFSGGDIEGTLHVLDKERLDTDLRDAVHQRTVSVDRVAQANGAIRQVFSSYDLRERVLENTLEFAAASSTVQRMMDIVQENPDVFSTRERVDLLRRQGTMAWSVGKYNDAEHIQTQAIQIADGALTVHDPLRGVLFNELGTTYASMGRFDDALVVLAKELELAKEFPGPDSLRLWMVMGNEAEARHGKLDVLGALAIYKDVTAKFMRDSVANAEHIGVLHTNTGWTLCQLGRFDEAVGEMNAAVAFQRRAVGNDHPLLAKALHGYAVAQMSRAEFQLAKEALQECLRIQIASLGVDHPDLCTTYDGLGYISSETGALADGLDLYGKALEVREQAMGPDDPFVALEHANIGYLLARMGRTSEGIAELKRSRSIQLRNMPPDDPRHINGLLQLADAWAFAWEPDSASACLRAAKDLTIASFGPDHFSIGDILLRQGDVYGTLGEYDRALPYYVECHEFRNRIMGETATPTGEALYNLAIAYSNTGQPDSAVARFRDVLAIYGRTLPPTHPYLTNCTVAMAWAMAKQQHYDTAMVLCKNMLAYQHGPDGSELPPAAATHTAMGWIDEALGRPRVALEEYDHALATLLGTGSARSWKVARLRFYQGRCLFALNEVSAAKDALNRSFTITPSKDAAWFLFRMAMDEGDRSAALDLFMVFHRARRWQFGVEVVDEEAALQQAVVLAKEFGRTDVLNEFENR